MPRKRTPTDATLAARALRDEIRAEAARMKAAAPATDRDNRVRLAQQIVRDYNDYTSLPDPKDPDVLSLVDDKRYPTSELYAMRDRQANLRRFADKRAPDRPLLPPPAIEAAKPKALAAHKFFKGVNLTKLTKAKEFMRVLDQIGPIPIDLVSPTMLPGLLARHWAYPEPTRDGYGTVLVVSEARREEWDPPWYTRAGKALGKTNPDLPKT